MDAMGTFDRRFLLRSAAVAMAAAQFGIPSLAHAQTSNGASPTAPAASPAPSSFGALKQIEAGELNVGYAEAGPSDGPVALLLHGWPYDIYSFVDATSLLSARGYRVIVPYLRGYGTTTFLSADTFRNAQPSRVALDIVALMDALHIDKAILGAFDWGARTANIIAALWPERVKAMVSVSGYLIGSQAAAKTPLIPSAEYQWWYQFYFATDRGQAGYDKYRHDFNKLIWQTASPSWNFDDATFDLSAAAFSNPDHVAIVVHNYRWRLALADGDPAVRRSGEPASERSGDLGSDRSRSRVTPTARRTPTRAPMPANSQARTRSGLITGGIGHNLPQEAPQAFADAIVDVDAF